MNSKRLFILCCLLALTFFGAASVSAQRSRNAVKDATWQTSVSDSTRGTVTLGIRDKWAAMKRYTASYVVTAPNKKQFRAQTKTSQDDWAYITFPKDFGGSTLAAGTYTVVFYANGVVVGRDKFRFRP
jgi:hypothetical protein